MISRTAHTLALVNAFRVDIAFIFIKAVGSGLAYSNNQYPGLKLSGFGLQVARATVLRSLTKPPTSLKALRTPSIFLSNRMPASLEVLTGILRFDKTFNPAVSHIHFHMMKRFAIFAPWRFNFCPGHCPLASVAPSSVAPASG
jgi:hypothetical protein